MDYTLIGYFPKRKLTRDRWPPADGPFPAPNAIDRIATVSYCLAKGPTSFDFPEVSQSSFNQYGGFNRIADALAAVENGEEFDLFAYALPDIIFKDGYGTLMEIGCVETEAFPDSDFTYSRVGFDIVEVDYCNLGHSPLTCNGQAGLFTDMLNGFCLVEQETDAIFLAKKFSIEQPEPGLYTVVEVWLLT